MVSVKVASFAGAVALFASAAQMAQARRICRSCRRSTHRRSKNNRLGLVSARRYRHEQSAGQEPEQRAVQHGDLGRRRAQGFRQRADLRPRRRLPVQPLVARRHHRRISRQGELPRFRHRPGRRRLLHRRISRHQVRMAGARPTSMPTSAPGSAFTPFIGAGIGASHNTISNFMDVNDCRPAASPMADTASKWNFAWALHAGISYKVNSQLSFEFAYRYVSLGDAHQRRHHDLHRHQRRQQSDGIPQHHLARPEVRRALDARCAASEKQPMMLPPLMRRAERSDRNDAGQGAHQRHAAARVAFAAAAHAADPPRHLARLRASLRRATSRWLSGWYVRGDFGYRCNNVDSVEAAGADHEPSSIAGLARRHASAAATNTSGSAST